MSRVSAVSILALVLLASASWSQTTGSPFGCPQPTPADLRPPSSESGVTPVDVGLFVIDVVRIDDIDQFFTADIHFTLRWLDPRLRVGSESGNVCTLALDDIWHPFVDFLNQRSLRRYFPETVTVDEEGWVFYRQRLYGDFSSPFNLRGFPFDSQRLPISLASFRYGPETVLLRKDEERFGRLGTFSVAGWTVDIAETRLDAEYLPAQGRELSRLTTYLRAQRHTGFFIWKVFAPVVLIASMAWAVFWINPTQIARLTVSTTSIFTLVAFQVSLGYLLPRISYLTRADRFIFGASILVFLVLAAAIATNRLATSQREDLVLRIDRHARWVYPILFLGICYRTLWG